MIRITNIKFYYSYSKRWIGHAIAYVVLGPTVLRTEARRVLKKMDEFRSRNYQRDVRQSLAINYITVKEEGRKEREDS